MGLELLQVRREDFAQTIFSGNVTLANPALGAMLQGARARRERSARSRAWLMLNATVVSYDYIFRLCAIVFVLSIPTVLLLRKARPSPGAATHAMVA